MIIEEWTPPTSSDKIPFVSSVSSVGPGSLIIKLPESILLPSYYTDDRELQDVVLNEYYLDDSAISIEVVNN